MIKKALFLSLLGVLCVGTALAGTKRQVTYKLNGTLGSGVFQAELPGAGGGTVELYFFPTQLLDGSAGYFADIYWFDGSNYHEIDGLLPGSDVKGGPGGSLTVNITKQDFYIEPNSPFDDDGAFISLEGTFTAYTGPGSGSNQQSGTFSDTTTDLKGDTETNRLVGTEKTESATFEGTFVVLSGTYDLSVQSPDPSAFMDYQAGSATDITTTP